MGHPDGKHRTRRSALRRPGLLAWLRMLRVTRRTEGHAAQTLLAWDLSYAQFDVLAQVGADEGISQQALAERLFVTQGNITQLLDKLEQRGLVRRARSGRTNRILLTDQGRELVDEVVPAHEDWLMARTAGLSEAEQRQLLRLLTKLDRAQRREQA